MWGFILGSVWGLFGIVILDSVFITLMISIAATIVMMITTVIKLEILMTPHWSYQIERQESVLKHLIMSYGKHFYESLDSGEQARDLPVYIGNEYHSPNDNTYNSSSYHHTNNNTIVRNKTLGGV